MFLTKRKAKPKKLKQNKEHATVKKTNFCILDGINIIYLNKYIEFSGKHFIYSKYLKTECIKQKHITLW